MGDLLICAANLAPEIDIILLTLCLGWRGEGLFYGSVQPPLLPPTNQRGTAYHVPIGQITRERANFDPTPTCAGPDASASLSWPRPFRGEYATSPERSKRIWRSRGPH